LVLPGKLFYATAGSIFGGSISAAKQKILNDRVGIKVAGPVQCRETIRIHLVHVGTRKHESLEKFDVLSPYRFDFYLLSFCAPLDVDETSSQRIEKERAIQEALGICIFEKPIQLDMWVGIRGQIGTQGAVCFIKTLEQECCVLSSGLAASVCLVELAVQVCYVGE
jgi:hypothetical protein